MIDNKTYDTIPPGWKRLKDATNHPEGFFWITDGKSMFDPSHRVALCRNSTKTND